MAKHEIWEVLGDHPEWLKVHKYRTKGNRSELMLNLNGKKYWFPVEPSTYKKFLTQAKTKSRGAGLAMLKKYIRQKRGYRGIWPDDLYYNKNKIPTKTTAQKVKKAKDSRAGTKRAIDKLRKIGKDIAKRSSGASKSHRKAHIKTKVKAGRATKYLDSTVPSELRQLFEQDATAELTWYLSHCVNEALNPPVRIAVRSAIRKIAEGDSVEVVVHRLLEESSCLDPLQRPRLRQSP